MVQVVKKYIFLRVLSKRCCKNIYIYIFIFVLIRICKNVVTLVFFRGVLKNLERLRNVITCSLFWRHPLLWYQMQLHLSKVIQSCWVSAWCVITHIRHIRCWWRHKVVLILAKLQNYLFANLIKRTRGLSHFLKW